MTTSVEWSLDRVVAELIVGEGDIADEVLPLSLLVGDTVIDSDEIVGDGEGEGEGDRDEQSRECVCVACAVESMINIYWHMRLRMFYGILKLNNFP